MYARQRAYKQLQFHSLGTLSAADTMSRIWCVSYLSFAVGAAFGVSGCTPGMNAAVQSARVVVFGPGDQDARPLDPNFAYLRVTRGRHVGLLWRGSMESSPIAPIEVYYSSTGEVVRLQNGRVVGALGLETEWRRVEIAAPPWDVVAASATSVPFVRTRDVMPGYRAGIRDRLIMRVIPAPNRSALRARDPGALTWFEEVEHQPRFHLPGTPTDTLPATRYAVDFRSGKEPVVVYSEQCLAADLCFTWQRWPAASKPTAASRAP